jgi:hypothetical protein
MLVAYFILIMISSQEWPMMAGPYTYEECLSVKEFLIRRDYDVSGCELLPLPQVDAVSLEIPSLP